jgi:hypothetical protein
MRPRIDITTPRKAASIASNRNGSWVYQRLAPTSRMIPTSVLRVYAATWTMLAINRIAPTACTSATANATLLNPSSTANSRSIRSFWFSTFSTPGCPTSDLSKSSWFSGLFSLTMNDAGNASLPATSSYCGNFAIASS